MAQSPAAVYAPLHTFSTAAVPFAEAPLTQLTARLTGLLKRAGLNRHTLEHLLPAVPEGTGIPPLLHQTYATAELPPELQQNVAAMQALNPRWQYRLYTDADIEAFIAEDYGPVVLQYYQRLNPRFGAARADLFRYLLLYRRGGLYLDIKSSLTRPLDSVLQPDDCFLLSQWRNGPGQRHEEFGLHEDLTAIPGGEYQQWFIAAAPGHPFLRAVIGRVLANIDHYNYGLHGARKDAVLRVTGPIAFTLAIAPLRERYRHRVVDQQDDLGVLYSVYGDKGRKHAALFKAHYTQLDEPLVQARGAARLVSALLGGVRRLRRR